MKIYQNQTYGDLEKDINSLELLVGGCKTCKFATCEQCEINWKQIQSISNVISALTKYKNMYHKEYRHHMQYKEYLANAEYRANFYRNKVLNIEHFKEDSDAEVNN